jgi:hypothetical protein
MWQDKAPRIYLKKRKLALFQKEYLQHATPAARKALADYTDAADSLWINNYLRGIHMEDLTEANKDKLRHSARILNSLIRDAPVSPYSVVLFRAINESAPRKQLYNTNDDAEFLFNGLVSTSVSFDAAASFVEDDQTCCMLVLYIPSGSKMLQVYDASAWADEKEVLLPHHSRFHVDKIDKINGITTYFCRMVEQTTSQRLV